MEGLTMLCLRLARQCKTKMVYDGSASLNRRSKESQERDNRPPMVGQVGLKQSLIDEFEQVKRATLLDLLRRATANGTHVQVADVIARDWTPRGRINPDGSLTVILRGTLAQ